MYSLIDIATFPELGAIHYEATYQSSFKGLISKRINCATKLKALEISFRRKQVLGNFLF